MKPDELDDLRDKHFGRDDDDEEGSVEEFERARLRFLHGAVPWWDWEA